jgi:dipeptidyl aminopeptidase/acylaminoacyl peptidase
VLVFSGVETTAMHISWLTLALLTGTGGAVMAAPAEAPSPTFQGRDLFALQWATDPQIRPDGRSVAYVRRAYDVMTDSSRRSIWVVDADTGLQSPLVAGSGSHLSPRWSPDGTRLAYVSSGEGGRTQLFVRWMQSGSSARIADLIDTPDEVSWSPDGKSIAFLMFVPDEQPALGEAPAKPEGATWAPPLVVVTDVIYRADGAGNLKAGYTHAFVVSAEGGAPRQLTFGAFNETGPLSWTPDGRHVILTGNRIPGWQREPVNTEVYQVSVTDASIKPLTTRVGPDNGAVVSPDGKQIAYLSFEDRVLGFQNNELYLMKSDGSNPRSLTAKLDRNVDAVHWAADGRSLYIQYVDKGVGKLARVSLTGRVDPIAEGLSADSLDRPYSGGQFSVASNGTAAFTSGTPDSPSDVSVVRGGKTKRLTWLNAELFRGKQLGKTIPLEVKSSFDQRPIDAWLVTPPNFDPAKKYPLILEIHGGPFASYGPMFSTDYQLYAAAGYIVLYTNPRGSTSYGEEFANFINRAYPGHDYDDLMSSVDAAIARGSVDPENLFVTGGSGGGILTAWIIGKTQRFRAAASQKPVINWTSTVLTTDVYTYMPKYWFTKAPWEDQDEYWKRSPLSLVGSVVTPTLVVVGDQDLRTPVADSEQYYQALQLKGVPTALVKVPGASHGGLAARPSQSAAKASAILAWFDRYRKKEP